MRIGTRGFPTYLVDKSRVNKIGKIIRKTKIDEIPYFFNVIKGEISIVVPRPCLVNQKELTKQRKNLIFIK